MCQQSLSFFLVFVFSLSFSVIVLSTYSSGAGQDLLLGPAVYSGVLAGWMAQAADQVPAGQRVDAGTVLAQRPMPCLTISATPPAQMPSISPAGTEGESHTIPRALWERGSHSQHDTYTKTITLLEKETLRHTVTL